MKPWASTSGPRRPAGVFRSLTGAAPLKRPPPTTHGPSVAAVFRSLTRAAPLKSRRRAEPFLGRLVLSAPSPERPH